jgi:hypothetical protein
MSEYTFDEEKIRRNAKRASSRPFFLRDTRWLPLATAAALLITVFGGYALLSSQAGEEIVQPGGTISLADRLNDKINNEKIILTETLTTESSYMYISFARPLTYRELDTALSLAASDTGSIRIILLWNGSFIQAQEARNDTAELTYTGAKVRAANNLYLALSARAEFSWVEFEGIVNDDNFEPLIPTETDNIPPFIPAPPPPTNNTPDPSPGDDPNSGTDPSPGDDPIEITLLKISVENALSVEFLSDSRFIILTTNSVLLYEITETDGRRGFEVIKNYEAANPKISYADLGSGSLVIIGGDENGRQTCLFLADGASGELIKLDTAGITGEAFSDISYAFFKNGDIVLKAIGAGNNAIFAAKQSANYAFEKIEESTDRLIILTFTGADFIIARVQEDATTLYRYCMETYDAAELEHGIGGEITFWRSSNLVSFAVQAEDDVSWFKLDGAELAPTEDGEINARRTCPSASYRLYEITAAEVRIEVMSNS